MPLRFPIVSMAHATRLWDFTAKMRISALHFSVHQNDHIVVACYHKENKDHSVVARLHSWPIHSVQYSLHDRVVKKGVSFLRGNVSIITSSDLSDMHVISMNVILPPRRREG